MSWFTKAIKGPIGQKIIMALTGLLLISFLCIHLTGNLMLMDSNPEPFNKFVDWMETNPLIMGMEYVLFGGFFLHIIYSAILTLKNRAARPVRYAEDHGGENSTWFSRNMGLSGSVVLVFLVAHLNTFFIPEKITHSDHRTFYDVSMAAFASPGYVIFYVAAMVLLAFHLRHAFTSAFQTLGLRHPRYTPLIQFLGSAYSILVPLGFALIPVYVLLSHK